MPSEKSSKPPGPALRRVAAGPGLSRRCRDAARTVRQLNGAGLDQDVGAGAAVELIHAAVADQDVVAGAAEDRVVTGAADQHVVAVAAVDGQRDRPRLE